jgi:plasmid stability protein
MGKLIVELPDEIHGELKKRAAVNHKTLKDIITELIYEYLYTPEKHVPAKKKTGLCGSWDDERMAEEIIKDIKTHRKWFTRRKN